MSEPEYCRESGNPLNKGIVAHIRQLIFEGCVEKRAIVKIMGSDTVSPNGLNLTCDGTRFVSKSLRLN